jgi:hypothetical protein
VAYRLKTRPAIAFALICATAAVVAVFGWLRSENESSERPVAVRTSNVEAQQRMKDALRAAGIPFSIELREGQEFITWPPEHNAAAEAVIGRFPGKPISDGRNAQFPDPALQKEFTDWLSRRGIRHQVIRSHGQDYVVWDRDRGDLVTQFMENRGADCKERVAGKGAAARC